MLPVQSQSVTRVEIFKSVYIQTGMKRKSSCRRCCGPHSKCPVTLTMFRTLHHSTGGSQQCRIFTMEISYRFEFVPVWSHVVVWTQHPQPYQNKLWWFFEQVLNMWSTTWITAGLTSHRLNGLLAVSWNQSHLIFKLGTFISLELIKIFVSFTQLQSSCF